MIVWALISIYVLVLFWRYRNKDVVPKNEFIVTSSIFAVIFLLSMVCIGRSYTSTDFHIEYPAKTCKITNENNNVVITAPDSRKFVVGKDKFTTYEAPTKDSEMVEVIGQNRIYNSDAPSFLYKWYFLEDAEPSTECVIEAVNISKFN